MRGDRLCLSYKNMKKKKKKMLRCWSLLVLITTCSLIIILNLVINFDHHSPTIPSSQSPRNSSDASGNDNRGRGLIPTTRENVTWPVTCKTSQSQKSCDLHGDIRIDPNSPTIYYIVPSEANVLLQVNNIATPAASIKPYTRNWDWNAMRRVREWSIKFLTSEENLNNNHTSPPPCSEMHDSPGVIFSLAGYTRNYFHSFTDVLIPLFATTRSFDRQVVLLTTNHQLWFVSLFQGILQALSRYDVVDIDKEQHDGKVHCFSRLILGLRRSSSLELHIDPSDSDRHYTMTNFRQLLRSAYSLNKTSAIKLQVGGDDGTLLPRLFIINRLKQRSLENIEHVAAVGREVGFEVIVGELDMNTTKTATILNSCDVLVGVHGAGLTNMVFLPDNGVVIQVVPFALDWWAMTSFITATKDMNVRHLEYRIDKEESSLWKQYPHNHTVLTDPGSYYRKGWVEWSSIYLDNQNVSLNVDKFRTTLLKALELLHL